MSLCGGGDCIEFGSVSEKLAKVWSRIKSPRPRRAAASNSGGGYASHGSEVRLGDDEVVTTLESSDRDSFPKLVTFAPRYRFRDLLLGDFSFNDDGER